MNCLWCNVGFEPERPWQKFCCKDHRVQFNAKAAGYRLPHFLDRELKEMAEAQQVSNLEMLCKIVHQTINPGQQPLSDGIIYGKQ